MLTHDSTNVLVFDASVANQNNFFSGAYNTLQLDFDPLINGFSFFKWTRLPKWLTDTFGYFQALTEKNFKEGFNLSDIELETLAMTYGFNANEYNYASGIKKANTDFNIKHQEFSGSPIRNGYQYWISGIRDPEIGIATYAKAHGTDYAAKNHTGEICYIVTRPDANNVDRNNMEFASYWSAVIPTKIQLSQFAHAIGSHNETEYDQSFKGCFHMGAKVDAYAKKILETEVYGMAEMSEFSPMEFPGHDNLKDSKTSNTVSFSAVPDSSNMGKTIQVTM